MNIPTRSSLEIRRTLTGTRQKVRIVCHYPVANDYRLPSGAPLGSLLGRTGYIRGPSNQYNSSYLVVFYLAVVYDPEDPDRENDGGPPIEQVVWDIHDQFFEYIPSAPLRGQSTPSR